MRDGPKSDSKPDWQIDAGTKAAVESIDEDRPIPTARGVLSAAEIEALLRPNTAQGALESATPPQNITPRPPENFDLAIDEPDPEQDRRAQRLASRLALALSSGAGVKAAMFVSASAKIDRAELTTLMQGKTSAVACIGPSETDIRALVCIPPLLADAIIAKACGARGSTGRIGDGWSLSAIDCALLEQLLVPFGEAVAPDHHLQAIETDMAYVSSLIPVARVNVNEYTIEAPGLRSELAVIEGDVAELEAPEIEPDVPATQSEVTALLTARLASLTVPLSRLTELKAGSTLLLGLPPDQPVELLSGDRDGPVAFEGRMGRKSNKVAVKLTRRLRSFNP